MKNYIVYDTRNGKVLHTFRYVKFDGIGDSTDKCDDQDVLATYRGDVKPDFLGVAHISDFQPVSSRQVKEVVYDIKTKKLKLS